MPRDTDQTAAGRHPANGETAAGGHGGTGRRYSVHEAALLLGLTVDAVRKRAERGRLKKEKAPDGTVYIVLDTPHETGRERPATGQEGLEKSGHSDASATGRLVESLQDQVRHLRHELDARNEELRRKDRLLAMILERVPEIEGSPGLSEEPVPDSEEPEPNGDTAPGDTNEEAAERRRSWFMRFFFGP